MLILLQAVSGLQTTASFRLESLGVGEGEEYVLTNHWQQSVQIGLYQQLPFPKVKGESKQSRILFKEAIICYTHQCAFWAPYFACQVKSVIPAAISYFWTVLTCCEHLSDESTKQHCDFKEWTRELTQASRAFLHKAGTSLRTNPHFSVAEYSIVVQQIKPTACNHPIWEHRAESLLTYFWPSSCWCAWADSGRWHTVWGSCHLCGRLKWSSRILISASPSPGHWRCLEVNQLNGRFPFFLCHSIF